MPKHILLYLSSSGLPIVLWASVFLQLPLLGGTATMHEREKRPPFSGRDHWVSAKNLTPELIAKLTLIDLSGLAKSVLNDPSHTLGHAQAIIDRAMADLRLLTKGTKDDPEAPRERLRVLDALVLLHKEFPPRQFLFSHGGDVRIAIDALYLMDGLSRAGKGMLSTALAVSLATGRGFGDWVPIEPRSVVIITVEDTERRMRARIKGLLAGMGLEWADLGDRLRLIIRPSGGIDLGNIRDYSALRQAIAPYEPDLIILDNLARMLGSVDENTPEVRLAMEAADRLRAVTGAAVLLVHHWGKGGAGRTGVHKSRGHSSIPAFVDAHLTVEREGETARLTHHDGRDDQDWSSTWRLILEDEGEILRFVVQRTEQGSEEDNETTQKLLAAIETHYFKESTGASVDLISGLSKLSKKTVSENLGPLVAIKRIQRDGPGGRAGYIYFPKGVPLMSQKGKNSPRLF
jgi:hypothetical protein